MRVASRFELREDDKGRVAVRGIPGSFCFRTTLSPHFESP